MNRTLLLSPSILLLSCVVAWMPAARGEDLEIRLKETDAGVEIFAGDAPFATYHKLSGRKPIVWPIYGPDGQAMTRGYPMEYQEGERKDHVHHRSLWFTHGEVAVGDGPFVSFWHEEEAGGRILHQEFTRLEDGQHGVVATRNHWVGPDGKFFCEDVRTLTFSATPDARVIDFDIDIWARVDPVRFGDTKEGSFGVRVAGTMKESAGLGGTIVTSEGKRGESDAWGKPAAWIDYHGPVNGKTAGIAILNHPSSFRYPTRWHVRGYGLFAANVFGLHDFERSDAVDGSYELGPQDHISFRYRVIFHRGDEKAGHIAERFEEYAEQEK